MADGAARALRRSTPRWAPHYAASRPYRGMRPTPPTNYTGGLDCLDVPELDPAEDARGVIDDLRAGSKVNGELLRVATTDVEAVELEQ